MKVFGGWFMAGVLLMQAWPEYLDVLIKTGGRWRQRNCCGSSHCVDTEKDVEVADMDIKS